ncbi:zona pellucida sperm-binding protein 3-like [Hemicordylus capensis]|uniref:zona pellucida sperm-binding protein 3-like n=1 Tax=Hemicordylus capensis TaxID=884348 RepID=UPI002304A312|nr:zona pellucida sperm-binding protein 3-like [Hemicordylus capensis]
MGLRGYSSGLLLCFIIIVVESYNPWDFSPWGSFPRPFSSVQQSYDPDFGYSRPWAWVDVSQPRALSSWKPVMVQCGEAQVAVIVNRDLFGTGRLVQAADLRLGSAGCEQTSLDAEEGLVVFEAGLHECGSTLKMTPDSLVYSLSLYYKPNPGNNPAIIRTSPVEVPIECHYPRKDNASSKAIKPSWVPFSSTISAEERLVFSLHLMKDDWSAERPSNRYQLGDTMNIQATVDTENHLALRLFIDKCVATMSPDRNSSPRYSVIDSHGCLVDGRSDDSSSAFVSPRAREDSLQFTVDAFRFPGDNRDLIYITCHLKVTAADQSPDTLNKACSFNKARNSWSPVEGSGHICSCCETQHCGLLGGQSRRADPWQRGSGGRFRRDASPAGDSSVEKAEAYVVVGLVFLDVQKTSVHLPEDQRTLGLIAQGPPKTSVLVIMGLTIVTAFLTLASVTLGVFFSCKKSNNLNVYLQKL